ENQLFDKFFPKDSQIPQKSFFCNNANSAILKSVWKKYKFDESLTGLEDMYLGKQVVAAGGLIGYVAEAPVYHYHDESWSVVKRRYEREAIALQEIMPEVQINLGDFLRYFISAVLLDAGSALQQKKLSSKLGEIFMFRLMQFWGSYRGNHEHRKISAQMKEMYFYPRNISKENYS
ncbi:MAG: glycosyltransferase family 2 protein, partial [Dolichospermum sp.]